MSEKSNKPIKVLLVDDMLTSRYLIKLCLKLPDYSVDEVSNGEDALRKLKLAPFDIAILDVMMPGMDGIELCTHIRKDSELADLPIIMITSLNSSADLDDINQAGATCYLEKPFNANELRMLISQLSPTVV